ncbi:MAG: histidine ammonia-lyase [Planctomycetota bacterium]|jgi:histidine ammonia-lyase
MATITLVPGELTLDDLRRVASEEAELTIDPSALDKVRASRAIVERLVQGSERAYGINTGFGALKDRAVPREDLEKLQENLVCSHAVGLGAALPAHTVRAMMLLRLNSLALGYSGVREEVLLSLLDMLNKGIHPVVPRDGSVGASGDLAPLAHVALAMLGKGKARHNGELLSADEALRRAGLKPLRLQAKEGLALTNGTQLMAAYAAHLTLEQRRLYKTADVVASMSIEAGIGTRASCDPRIHEVRPHGGQASTARNIWRLLENSGVLSSHVDCSKVQDQYSFRCTPQVHGSARDGLAEKTPTVLVEMNSATDNPLVFADGSVLSGGNFHGGTIARVLAEFGPAIASTGAISEKRTAYLIDPKAENGLPGFLVDEPHSSGFMLPQYVAAAYVAENGKLATPVANLTGISTSANQEDHVSMGTVDGKYAGKILENVWRILGIEFLCAAQALDLQEKRLKAPPARSTAACRDLLRSRGVAFIEEDEEFGPLVEEAVATVQSPHFLDAAGSAGVDLD